MERLLLVLLVALWLTVFLAAPYANAAMLLIGYSAGTGALLLIRHWIVGRRAA